MIKLVCSQCWNFNLRPNVINPHLSILLLSMKLERLYSIGKGLSLQKNEIGYILKHGIWALKKAWSRTDAISHPGSDWTLVGQAAATLQGSVLLWKEWHESTSSRKPTPLYLELVDPGFVLGSWRVAQNSSDTFSQAVLHVFPISFSLAFKALDCTNIFYSGQCPSWRKTLNIISKLGVNWHSYVKPGNPSLFVLPPALS